MTIDPNTFMMFYLILALLAVAIGITAYALSVSRGKR